MFSVSSARLWKLKTQEATRHKLMSHARLGGAQCQHCRQQDQWWPGAGTCWGTCRIYPQCTTGPWPAIVAMPQCPAVPCCGCGDNIGLHQPQIFPRLRTAITEHSASCGHLPWTRGWRLEQQWSVDLANWIIEAVCGTQDILLSFLGL